jgi:hypothetical protein
MSAMAVDGAEAFADDMSEGERIQLNALEGEDASAAPAAPSALAGRRRTGYNGTSIQWLNALISAY